MNNRLISLLLFLFLMTFLPAQLPARGIRGGENISSHKIKNIRGQLDIELGPGMAMTPHYPGSDQVYNLVFPYPRISYGRLFVERGVSDFYLYKNKHLKIDLTASGRLPVNSASLVTKEKEEEPNLGFFPRGKNFQRRGMPDLPLVFLVGSEIESNFLEIFTLELPVYYGIEARDWSHIGNTFSPKLQIDMVDEKSKKHYLHFSINCLFGDKKYNRFYYSVDKKYVLVNRVSYRAKAGLVSATYGISYELSLANKIKVGARYFIHDMSQATVKESPLVLKKKSDSAMIYVLFKL